MTIQSIKKHITPIATAISEMEKNINNISGMVVLVCTNKDEDYDFYIAGSVGAERAIGRLEIIKQAIINKVNGY